MWPCQEGEHPRSWPANPGGCRCHAAGTWSCMQEQPLWRGVNCVSMTVNWLCVSCRSVERCREESDSDTGCEINGHVPLDHLDSPGNPVPEFQRDGPGGGHCLAQGHTSGGGSGWRTWPSWEWSDIVPCVGPACSGGPCGGRDLVLERKTRKLGACWSGASACGSQMSAGCPSHADACGNARAVAGVVFIANTGLSAERAG